MIPTLRVAATLAGIFAFAPLAAAAPLENFLFLGGDGVVSAKELLARADIAGAQVVYTWRQLEPAKGQYDFSAIDADLAAADAAGKQLFVQVQDRFFDPKARNVPDYLMQDAEYDGGLVPQFDNPGENKPIGSGWVAAQWNPAVQARYQALLQALAARFDGKVFGINLPETAIDLDDKHLPAGFSCDAYFAGEMANLAAARQAFTQTQVVQYVNFWPCEWNDDHRYMDRLFAYAAANGVGLGGPDVVPYRKGQMKNSYPFFHADIGKLKLVAMAVQEPTLTYTNPKTKRPFTRAEIEAFATDYLGANIVFWTPQAPWLKG